MMAQHNFWSAMLFSSHTHLVDYLNDPSANIDFLFTFFLA